MSTEMNTQGAGFGPETSAGDFGDEAAGGELFIGDLPSTATRPPGLLAQFEDDEVDEDEGEEGIVTTQMLGEEGDRGGEKEDGEEGIRTTLAIGEEGDRGGE